MLQPSSDISYLKEGNLMQQKAYQILTTGGVMEKLQAFDPILVGTIPININIEKSDLDIVCYVSEPSSFIDVVSYHFDSYPEFRVRTNTQVTPYATVISFFMEYMEVELFGQNNPSHLQNAYCHMVIEDYLLRELGEVFRKRIVALKKDGYKTEPAYAKELGLKGDP